MNFRFYRLIFCQCTAALANAALRFALSLHLLRVTSSAALIAVSAFSLRFKVAIAAASVYTGYKYTLHKGALLCLRKPGKNAMNGWTC